MANIHIARNHQSLGSFSEESVREGIQSGRFTSSDLAWREGMPEWKPLGDMAPQWGMDLPAPSLEVEEPSVAVEMELPGEGHEPAWEEREPLGFFPAITRTVSAVLLRPTQTFASLKQTGGLANPLLLSLIHISEPTRPY